MTASEGSEGDATAGGGAEVRPHLPVLLRETLEVLGLQPGMTVVDGTVGAGGHAREIARAIGPTGLLIGLDRDAEILARAHETLSPLSGDSPALSGSGERAGFRLHHLSFARIQEALEAEGLRDCDRVLLDLGVSSPQLDVPERGFSFMQDGPLDMRMDRSAGPTAAEWLHQVSERELARVLADYGEERFARRIAGHLVEQRARKPLRRTGQLVEAVLRALPGPARRQRIHPATRTFQAIRIAVNDELGELQRGLEQAHACLRPEGRLVVISFHSLEDRIVKRFLRERMQLPFRKPIVPSDEESRRNPRARSAKLRCGIKAAPGAPRDARDKRDKRDTRDTRDTRGASAEGAA